MSDMFDIICQEPTKTTNKHKISNDTINYIKLQAQFLTSSFGHYTIKFVSMIAQQAACKFLPLKSVNVNKLLRQIVKKYFLSDLELVYVGYIGSLLGWNINSSVNLTKSKKMSFSTEGQPFEASLLLFFLNLIAFFVKKYVGQHQEYKAIADYLNKQSQGQWNSIYQQWLQTLPNNIFKLSPRQINLVFSKYTKNCQQSIRKNYNHMVDQIMQLSTTYAMIPGESREIKKGKKENKTLKIFEQEKQQEKDLIEPYLFGRKNFKPDEVSHIKFSKKSDSKKFSQISNQFIDVPQPTTKPRIRLGNKGNKQSQINNTVTDFFCNKETSELVINKRYVPQSTIGIVDPNPSMKLFDSKLFSSGSEIIPYPLRSNSNLFRSKLFE